MKEEQILNCLKKETLLDEKTIYTYASSRSAIGGAIGSINGLVLLSINGNILYIHQANIDNSYGERLAKIYISDMKNIQGKAGMFGGKFSFIMTEKNINLNCHQKPENLWIFL